MIELYKQALISYKIYLVMAPGTPLDKVALKWPDIAESAIYALYRSDGDPLVITKQLKADICWMLYEPIRRIYNATVERAAQVLGKPPGKFTLVPEGMFAVLCREPYSTTDLIKARDSLVKGIDELLGIINTMTSVEYPKLGRFLEVPLASNSNN